MGLSFWFSCQCNIWNYLESWQKRTSQPWLNAAVNQAIPDLLARIISNYAISYLISVMVRILYNDLRINVFLHLAQARLGSLFNHFYYFYFHAKYYVLWISIYSLKLKAFQWIYWLPINCILSTGQTTRGSNA